MPLTRKSTTTPVRATRSHGSVNEEASQKPKNAPRKPMGTDESKVTNSGKATKSLKLTTQQPTRSTRGSAVLSNDEDTTNSFNQSKEDTRTADSRKRTAAEALVDNEAAKRRKTGSFDARSSQDFISPPRRSSRAVIPNSRFKDMELIDIGKKKTAIKDDKKSTPKLAKEKSRMDFTQINVQVQPESETVMEEVITDTTEIDTQAQMNMFDDILILPPSTANEQDSNLPSAASVTASISPCTFTETVAISEPAIVSSSNDIGMVITEDVEIDHSSAGKVSLPIETCTDDVIMSEIENDQSSSISSGLYIETSSGSELSSVKTGVKSDSASILAENSTKITAKSDLSHKGKVIVIGPEQLKKKPRKSAHLKQEQQQMKKAFIETAEGIEIINIENKTNSIKAKATRPPKIKLPSGTIRSAHDVFISANSKNFASNVAVPVSATTMISNADSSGVPLSVGSITSQGVMPQTQFGNAAPQVKVVYVQAKPKSKLDNKLASNFVISKGDALIETTQSKQVTETSTDAPSSNEYPLTEQSVFGVGVPEEEAYHGSDDIVTNSSVHTSSCTESVQQSTTPSDTVGENIDGMYTSSKADIAELGNEESVAGIMAGNELQNSGQQADRSSHGKVTNSKRKIDQNLMSSFCEVIEFDKRSISKGPTTAIEFVMFDDKMVPIHKPATQIHGRVQISKPQVKHVHGRVESANKALPATAVKKIPLSAIQSVIQSVIDHRINPDQDLNSVEIVNKGPVDSHQQIIIKDGEQDSEETDQGKHNTPQNEQSEGKDVLTVSADGKVVHGYIDHPEQGSDETKIVEISPDLFTKEVFGDAMLLDPTTGELIPQSESEVPGLVIPQTDSKAESESKSEAMDVPDCEAVSAQCVNSSGDAEPDADVTVQTVASVDNGVPATDVGPIQIVAGAQAETANSHSSIEVEGTATLTHIVDVVDNKLQVTEINSDKTFPQADQPAPVSVPTSMPVQDSMADQNVVIRIENDGSSPGTSYTLQKMTDGEEALVFHIDESSFLKIEDTANSNGSAEVNAGPGNAPTQKLTAVKINPAAPATLTSGKGIEKNYITVKSAVSGTSIDSEGKDGSTTEIQTQTEYTDDEEEKPPVSGSEPRSERVIIVNPRGDDTDLKKTKVVLHEDGRYQEYVMVHLPEGTEIKNKGQEREEMATMSEDGMYVCMDCGHKTFKKGNWYKHRRKHLGIRPHACTKCSYRAATSSNLKRHMEIHDDIRNFTCTICGLLFRQKIHLERHIKYKHQEKKVKCPLCDYMCASENPDLKIHIRKRHMPQEDGSMSAFTCDDCGLMTVSKKDLKQHMKFHKKGPELKLFCEFCSFVTDCESRLRRHMLIHTKERPFQCGLCEYRGSQKEHVLRHMRSQHDIEIERNPRKQAILDSIDGSKPRLRRSLLEGFDPCAIVQKGKTDEEADVSERPFEKSDYSSTDKIFACNHCTMKFSKLINLYKHLYAQHKQVMPDPTLNDFQCVVCDFRTNSKKNLLVHMRRHNMQDHTPPSHVYSCVLCRYINPRRRNLFQHMKKKHGIEILMKEDGTNCYVSSDNSYVVLGQQGMEDNVMALSEIVTTHSLDDDSQLQIVTEDGEEYMTNKIPMETMSIDDITSSQDSVISSPQTPSASLYQPTVAEHEAAEAIEGLQALAQQAGVVETQTIDGDITAAALPEEEILTSGEIITAGEETLIDQNSSSNNGIQLSTEQFNQLSSGDFVEINGEVYKVEIAAYQDGQKAE